MTVTDHFDNDPEPGADTGLDEFSNTPEMQNPPTDEDQEEDAK